MPGLLWVQGANNIHLSEAVITNQSNTENGQPITLSTGTQAIVGYFSTRDVVTLLMKFSDRTSFMQSDNSALQISPRQQPVAKPVPSRALHWIWGALNRADSSKNYCRIFVTFWAVTRCQCHLAIRCPVANGGTEGRWSELEAVVQSVETNSNGSLREQGMSRAHLWFGKFPPLIGAFR